MSKALCYIFAMKKISGEVVSGRKVGTDLGFPTLNLNYDGDLQGVFAGVLLFNGEKFPCAVNLGHRPTFDAGSACEIHVVSPDFKAAYCGDYVEVNLFDKIRDVQKFENVDDLVSAIASDVEFVKNWYTSMQSDL